MRLIDFQIRISGRPYLKKPIDRFFPKLFYPSLPFPPSLLFYIFFFENKYKEKISFCLLFGAFRYKKASKWVSFGAE